MSSLKLNSLLVSRKGINVYFEIFHSGINIIRGHNSTGKSTISNFIFYILGGEFIDWLPEAAECDNVLAEIEINGSILTLKREIDSHQRRPMAIFIGNLDKALKSNIEGWNIYPYSKTDKTQSFSQIIFNLLDFPEISTENQESITINQILRLLYIDQLSALDSLMRNEDFDSPLIRAAIGHLLLGTYNDKLLRLQISLRQKERELSDIKKQVAALEDVLNNSPFEFNREKIQTTINEKQSQLLNVLVSLQNPDKISENIKSNDTKNEIKKLQSNLINIKSEYNKTLNQLSKLNSDILDSNDFVNVLSTKLTAINESLNSREILGNFPIQYCPVCLEKLDENVLENHCKLCKKEIKEDPGKSKLVRMKLEVEMQIRESSSILTDKKKDHEKYNSSLKEIERKLYRAQQDYDIFINQSRTSLDNKYDKVLEQKGKLIADIDFLDKQMQLFNSYNEYKTQLFALKSGIDRLTDEITRESNIQRNKSTTAYSRIQKYALELLKGDGLYEEKFQDGRKVTVNFSKNTFYLDDRNRFSASSMVLLKNCVRFAIFFASIDLEYFRYPKFIFCDNVEDKGMEEKRSQNFQKNILKLANSENFRDKDFQIIITTSMVADELNLPQYTIGKFYGANNKSLNL